MALTFLSPILWTRSLEETSTFYEKVLGFTARSRFPNFVSLFKDEVQIMFIVPVEEPADCKDPNDKEPFFPKPQMTGDLYITTDDVDKLYISIKDKVQFKTDIGNREYLMRDFSILDNNGYELCFGQDISQTANP